MFGKFYKLGGVIFLACLFSIMGCVQMPTEQQSIVDDRPTVDFVISNKRSDFENIVVFVDGVEMGMASNFRAGVSKLRILPGMHSLMLQVNGVVLLREDFYISSGSSRSFVVN